MKQDKNELALVEKNSSLTVQNNGDLGVQAIDVNSGNLPDLEDADELPLDLMSNYWSPALPGETKRVFFDSIKTRAVQDQQNPEVVIDLPCAYFFEKVKDKNGVPEIKTISNGSKRLVAAIENNNIQRGTPLVIEYLGKKRNATNSFSSDDWSVKPLILK